MISDTYTFRTFVGDRRTHDALAAAIAVAETRGHNPLILVGGIGSGKTHLLHEIANALQEQRRRVRHLDAWTFVRQCIDEFRFDMYGTAFDALLLDDLHVLADKPNSQIEVVRQIEKLVARGGQAIVTSDARTEFVESLVRHVPSSFVAEIPYPDRAAREEIVRRTAAARGVAIPERKATEIAETASVPREIHSRIARFQAESTL